MCYKMKFVTFSHIRHNIHLNRCNNINDIVLYNDNNKFKEFVDSNGRVNFKDLLFQAREQNDYKNAVNVANLHCQGRLGTFSLKTATSVINIYRHADLPDQALRVLQIMQSFDIKPSIYSYNAVLSALADAGRWKSALELFKGVRQIKNLKVDVFTYTAVLSALQRAGQSETAEAILIQMENDTNEGAIKPNIWHYACVIGACGNDGAHRTSTAINLLSYMEKKGNIKPNLVCFNRALIACRNSADVDTSFELLQQLIDQDIKPDLHTFYTIMDTCADSGNYDKGIWLINHMKNQGWTPNNRLYNTCLTAMMRGKADTEATMLFLRQIQASGDTRLNTATYNGALSSLALNNQWERAMSLLKEMKTNGVKPDDYSYAFVMSACHRSGQDWAVLELWREAKEIGLELKVHMSSVAAIMALCGSSHWREAVDLYERRCQGDNEDETPATPLPTVRERRSLIRALLSGLEFEKMTAMDPWDDEDDENVIEEKALWQKERELRQAAAEDVFLTYARNYSDIAIDSNWGGSSNSLYDEPSTTTTTTTSSSDDDDILEIDLHKWKIGQSQAVVRACIRAVAEQYVNGGLNRSLRLITGWGAHMQSRRPDEFSEGGLPGSSISGLGSKHVVLRSHLESYISRLYLEVSQIEGQYEENKFNVHVRVLSKEGNVKTRLIPFAEMNKGRLMVTSDDIQKACDLAIEMYRNSQ